MYEIWVKRNYKLTKIEETDEIKTQLANDNGFKLIRINCDYINTNPFQFIKNNIINSQLGEILNLYFAKSTSSEKINSLKLSKFSLFKLNILDLFIATSNNFCFKQLHIVVL